VADSPRIDELRRRVQKDPASIVFAQLAEEHRRLGQYHDAVQVARTGLARHPSYLSARVTLGRALIELEQYDDAQRELEHVLRFSPDNLAAIRGLADIHQRRGELGEAVKEFASALDLAPGELVLPDGIRSDRPLPARPADFELDLPGDDFARSLDALDALTFDLPAASEPPALDDPDVPVLRELEGWLSAIREDRARHV
jgi:tetratricopeptide (TPR) repeat protein